MDQMDEAISRRIRESQRAIAHTLSCHTKFDAADSGGRTAPGALPVMGGEALMCEKQHGTSQYPVQAAELRFGCEPYRDLAERITSYNRHDAENSGLPDEGKPRNLW